MKNPVCPICKQEMVIGSWNGWVWYCVLCDYCGRDATAKEIALWESDIEMYDSNSSEQVD